MMKMARMARPGTAVARTAMVATMVPFLIIVIKLVLPFIEDPLGNLLLVQLYEQTF